ncbi:hypothetical protein JOC85_002426 [Bacillus mesophilus]|nr:hypothetical protein [Bacillus mesophilus]MBM7661623.1 hypothetical protein [Bacillus mesophilus]
MPYYTFKEIWTPLSLFRIRFYKDVERGTLYIKVGKASRRQLF